MSRIWIALHLICGAVSHVAPQAFELAQPLQSCQFELTSEIYTSNCRAKEILIIRDFELTGIKLPIFSETDKSVLA